MHYCQYLKNPLEAVRKVLYRAVCCVASMLAQSFSFSKLLSLRSQRLAYNAVKNFSNGFLKRLLILWTMLALFVQAIDVNAQKAPVNPVALPPLTKSETPLPSLDAMVYQEAAQKPVIKDKGLDTVNRVLNTPITPDVLSKGPIVIPSTYLAYIDKVNKMSEGLLTLKERFDQKMTTMPDGENTPPQLVLSLQELGALTQRLSVDNRRFKMQFAHGEEHYQSYQLIEQAVTSLEDAINYWRLSNRCRSLYRAEAQEKQEDDAFLTLKLETAMTAIDALKTLQVMRERLKKLDEGAYP